MASQLLLEDNIPYPLWSNGPIPGHLYDFPGKKRTANQMAERTIYAADVVDIFPVFGFLLLRYPSVSGSSVLGVKFKDGVVLAADMLGAYGSLARYRNCSRLMKVTDSAVIGCSGDCADYQFLASVIKQRVVEEQSLNDGFLPTASGLHSWLTRVMYNQRCRFAPLWNSYVVAGVHADELFLGCVNMIGTAFAEDVVATGFGAYLALPMLRSALEADGEMDEKRAVQLVDQCMTVLHYRDSRSINKYEIAVVTRHGCEVKGPLVSEVNWETAHIIQNED